MPPASPRAVSGNARPVSNELAKALIINTVTGASFPVMYNPEELRSSRATTSPRSASPG